jgi:hypothetical protein
MSINARSVIRIARLAQVPQRHAQLVLHHSHLVEIHVVVPLELISMVLNARHVTLFARLVQVLQRTAQLVLRHFR